ncbi:unnamed protein product [Adineta steineri]|uniref:ABC transporter domain-containing protein n=1 Tax=Adineta steineri TaxID=433720 RepID=A0A819TR65_9BILA|nr:unnamed protein product [Adineta steineri]
MSCCQNEYDGNHTELNNLREFEEDYSPDKVLWWYTKETFFYKTLNAALRTQNIHMIFLFRAFIYDIYHQLQYDQAKDPLQVYRSQLMSVDELDSLKNIIGQFISVNSFFSTSDKRSTALFLLGDLTTQIDLERVLFEIDADPNIVTTKPFAKISKHSYFPDESEVLFTTGSIFRLNNIICNDDQIWIIKMTLCNDDEHDLKQVLMHMKQQIENEGTNLRTLGKLLSKMGKLDLAEKYFNRFLKELPSNDPLLGSLYEDLGELASQRGDYNMSVQWHQKSLAIKNKNQLTVNPTNEIINSSIDLLEAPIDEEHTMDSSLQLGLYDPINTNEYLMSKPRKQHQHLTKTEYSPIGSSRKLNLLLQRSLRYSYRQRCCRCCPTILCELLFPLILIGLLALTRHNAEALSKVVNDPLLVSRSSYDNECPQDRDITITTSLSTDSIKNCFKFPQSYKQHEPGSSYSGTDLGLTNFVFHPIINDTNVLVERAKIRLKNMNCENIKVWNQNIDDKDVSHLLQNEIENVVIIDFNSTSNLKNGHNLDYNIMVRMPSIIPKTDPVDLSFLSFLHPSFIPDRSNTFNSYSSYYEDTKLPEFSDVKMFIDSLLIGYQTNRNIEFELQRKPIICTPYRRDFLFESGRVLVGISVLFIDFVYFIPYLILLISLIREKNAKVKEILKVLGIEPTLNNFAQAVRTLIILFFLTILLCIIFKLKLKSDAYFNTVNFGILFIGYFIYGLQLISFCIMNAQLFDKTIRAILGTFFIYGLSGIIYSYTIVWPTAIKYILIFISPYIAGHSIFQQAISHDLAYKDVALFQTIYRHVPMYFVTLFIMIVSCVFYWILSWYLEKVFVGEYGIPFDCNFLFKRDYWRSEKVSHTIEALADHAVPLKRTHSNSTPNVHVDHLVKKFGLDKIAVNDVSFDLYENQITSLLGPNGSGKTTIFNCLLGIYKQTCGMITIESKDGMDFDTRTNMELLRKSMGYCPQHDILFDLLTVKEQIEFYAIARGFGKNKQQITSEILRLVNLEESQDLYCSALSRGMKRRLSLACAFVGDTKIILLDEPSSGLDPSNRRLLWDWLRSMKEGKTLLLTTHFMEESDALSDRIMIIANGVIKADGTSAKLKEQYGSGYKLIISKQSSCRTNTIENELRIYLPELKIEIDIPDGDVVFRTNQQPNNLFIQALRHLESMKINNQIKNYGVQNSTMDDVFLNIIRDAEVKNDSNSTSLDPDTIGSLTIFVYQ